MRPGKGEPGEVDEGCMVTREGDELRIGREGVHLGDSLQAGQGSEQMEGSRAQSASSFWDLPRVLSYSGTRHTAELCQTARGMRQARSRARSWAGGGPPDNPAQSPAWPWDLPPEHSTVPPHNSDCRDLI